MVNSKYTRTLGWIAVSGALAAGALGLTAGTASAAGSHDWEAVAHCESTDNWSIDSGNGFYGGLQFTQQTWDEFGGGTYAAHPQDATKEQQESIAENVLAVQGPGAWPVCGQNL
ncbi:transglycosylase family protein [Rhodococcus erythropolis]|uniref:transglycosylase family protein n=1 Tax=Rhodococcus erythropolis TaxID=1833 RepID=UPI002948CF60|nr:transglycosylase family protein [Rhodococcus erythropolis]MDV6278633.1 transglycosylase family protein [Rhodococcus erythropolis]